MPTDQAGPTFIIPFILIFAIFYFLVIKPEKSKQKQHKEMRVNLKKNDEIVTTAGIHATILNVKEKTLTVRIDDNVKIEIEKDAVSTVTKKVSS